MSFATATAAIDLSVSGSLRKQSGQSLGVSFFGGEPLLRRDLIVRIIQYCRAVEAGTGQKFYFKKDEFSEWPPAEGGGSPDKQYSRNSSGDDERIGNLQVSPGHRVREES
jgi:hypothetical protein